MDPASWKLTGEEKARQTTQVNACSLNLIGELMIPIQVDAGSHDSSFFHYLEDIDYDREPQDFFTQGQWEDYHKETFPPSPGVSERFSEYWTN